MIRVERPQKRLQVLGALVLLLEPGLALAQSPSLGNSAVAPSEAPEGVRVQVLILQADASAPLASALQVRLPGVELRRRGDADPPVSAGLRALVSISLSGAQLRLELVLSDGRVFVREIEAPAQSWERAAAGSLANLIAGIEAGTAQHDETTEELPEALAELEPEPDPPPPDPPKEEEPPEDPVPAEPPKPPVAPPSTADGVGVSDDGRPSTFVAARAASLLGLVPNPGLRGLGGGLRVGVDWRRGGQLALDGRATRGGSSDVRIVRTRVAFGGGWAARTPHFEMSMLGLASIEPWWVRSGGASVGISSQGLPQRPMWGLHLAVEPKAVLSLQASGRPIDLAFGVPVEVSGSAIAGSTSAARIRKSEGSSVSAVVGGLELELGIALTLRVHPRTKKRKM